MILCDVNLLVYATTPSMEAHRAARRWLLERLESDDLGLSHLAIFGFVRVVTNRRVFERPRSVDDALEDVEQLLDSGASMVSPGPRHLSIAFELLRKLGTAADLTTDVQLAAIAIENQLELHSADNDFRRFSGLRWVNPLER